jgi:hypothetical protein
VLGFGSQVAVLLKQPPLQLAALRTQPLTLPPSQSTGELFDLELVTVQPHRHD